MRSRLLLPPVAALTLALAVMQPATADETPATLTVTGGTLSITAPTALSSLGSRASTAGDSVISGSLGQVKVDDDRGAPAGSGWVVGVSSTPFSPSSGPAIPASAIGYTAGSITKVGIATYTPNNPHSLTGVAVPAVTATGITGNNSATWNPTIDVTVPDGMAAGVYSGTITHSVL